MHLVKFSPAFRSCALFLRSLSSFRQRSSSSPPPTVAQLPESSRERILQLTDQFQTQSKSEGQFSRALELFRTWATENREPPPAKLLEMLFTMCFRSGRGSDVDIALEYAETHGVTLSKGQVNALITSVAKSGDYPRTKQICEKMEKLQIEFRLSALCALLQQAAVQGDFPFMLTLSKQLSRHKNSLTNLEVVKETLKKVFEACVSVEEPAAFEVGCILVDTYRITRQKLSREMAATLSNWLSSGVCSGCGLALESGDISVEELGVLRENIKRTLTNTVQESANIKAEQRKMDVLDMIVKKNRFGAIIDGLNIAHVFQKHSPSRQQLLQVASEAADITGKPVLALMRKHCTKWFTTTSDPEKTIAEIGRTYEHLGLHCFFTNNFDEDDLYLLYATLFSDPSTFLVTNDLQGCNKHRLPVGCHDTFQQWLRRRLASIIKVGRNVKIQFPLVYDDTIQWSPKSSGPSSSWKNLHIPLNYRRRWLCVSEIDLSNTVDHSQTQLP